MRKTTAYFRDCKKTGEKLTMLTAYDYSMAKLVDAAGIDGILVGDSLGMVVLGYDNTLQVTVDDIIHHTKAVARGTQNALIVADMPFLSYHISVEDAILNAGRMIKEGMAHAVKLEGGEEIIDKVRAIINAQIPVMGHLGLTPQSINVFGGFKVQGKNMLQIEKIINDAKLLEEAGVFAIVLEGIPKEVAKLITEAVSVPTIGIGAGVNCDGQILVTQDLLGMYGNFVPKFVKKYRNLSEDIVCAFKEYISEVKSGEFPADVHSFKLDEETCCEITKLYGNK